MSAELIVCFISCIICSVIGVCLGFVWGEAAAYKRWWGQRRGRR